MDLKKYFFPFQSLLIAFFNLRSKNRFHPSYENQNPRTDKKRKIQEKGGLSSLLRRFWSSGCGTRKSVKDH